jgi:predicted amidohydrolase
MVPPPFQPLRYMRMTQFSVALWATNLTPRLNGIEAWLATVDEKLAEAGNAGANLLVMPEYACVQWLSFAPQGTTTQMEVPWMAAQAGDAVARLKQLVTKHEIGLLAGTMPVKVDLHHVNRAFLLLPDGSEFVQDKLCLTPGEADPDDWNLTPGDAVTVVEWRGLRLGVTVCLDIELPALSAILSSLALDVILVPSNTDALSGYHRVFACAKARAIELQTVICAVGTIGDVPYCEEPGSNVGGAAVYLPCEDALGSTGELASTEPRSATSGAGKLLVVRDLPIDAVRRMRAGEARVWPGAWSAAHITIDDPQIHKHAGTRYKA